MGILGEWRMLSREVQNKVQISEHGGRTRKKSYKVEEKGRKKMMTFNEIYKDN